MPSNRKRQDREKIIARKRSSGGGGFSSVPIAGGVAGGAAGAAGKVGSTIGHAAGSIGNARLPKLPIPDIGKEIDKDLENDFASFVNNIVINPIKGDFAKNRGKIVIGIAAFAVLLGGALHAFAHNETAVNLATSAVSPELESASLIRSRIGSGVHHRLQAREPIAPIRYAMKKAAP
jgi:hypothetical protein